MTSLSDDLTERQRTIIRSDMVSDMIEEHRLSPAAAERVVDRILRREWPEWSRWKEGDQ